MSYTPFLISSLAHGVESGMEPWLLPKDAFSTLKNCYLRRGVLQKRLGYELWDRPRIKVEDEAVGALGSTNYAGTLGNADVVVDSVVFTDGTQTITIVPLTDSNGDYIYDSEGVLLSTGEGDGVGSVHFLTGEYDITFDASTTGAVTVSYDYYPGNAITGIYTYYAETGTSDFLIFDTKRVYKYDSTNREVVDIAGSDIFTGDEDNFVWAEVWKGSLYATNNKDRIFEYDGSTFSEFDVDVDGDASNDVEACLLIFAYKSHLVLLRTTEGGDTHAQRARWCAASDPTDWTNDGYVDAPTLDWIVAADFIGDDLVVFFERSIWRLKYTGDYTLPFRWEMIVSTEGAYSTFSSAGFSDEIVVLGPTRFIATDGFDAYSIDDKIPDTAMNIDQDMFSYVYSIVVEENDQLLISYPSVGASASDKVLQLNYDENSWATFEMPIHCYGYFNREDELTWNDIDLAFDEVEWSWDEKALQGGFPTTLGGTTDGYIYTLFTGSSDAGDPIEFEVLSGRWNPFAPQGQKARFGYIDFLVDRDPDITFYVDFYIDQDTTPYLTETVNCGSDNDVEEKIWVRVYCGEVGAFHRIRLYHTASAQTVKIHALMPWFKPAGRISG